MSMRGRLGTLPWTVLLCGAMVLAVGTPATAQCDGAVELEADFFIEINGSDGDAGVQLMLDGEGWNHLTMTDPDGFTILEVDADDLGSIGIQGLTEFFFESAEPSFDDQSLEELFVLFPEGGYVFEGETTGGEPACVVAELTYNLPAIPEATIKTVRGTTTISWKPVNGPFEDPGNPPADVGDEIEIEMYRVIVEALDEEGEGLQTLDVELPANAHRLTIPKEFVRISPEREFKFEVIATEESGNQTILEGEFSLHGDDDQESGQRSRRGRR